MYQINIKVNADETLSTLDGTLRLGTEQEVSRTKLFFEIDASIEGTIRYVKFVHKRATYLYRVTSNNSLIVPTNVCRYAGRWFLFLFIVIQQLVDHLFLVTMPTLTNHMKQ